MLDTRIFCFTLFFNFKYNLPCNVGLELDPKIKSHMFYGLSQAGTPCQDILKMKIILS